MNSDFLLLWTLWLTSVSLSEAAISTCGGFGWLFYCNNKAILPHAEGAFTFDNAATFCRLNLTSTLPIVTTEEDLLYISYEHQYSNGWLGLMKNTSLPEGWIWLDGSKYDPALSNWDVGMPSGLYSCAYRNLDGKWRDDYDCSKVRRVTCECAVSQSSTCTTITAPTTTTTTTTTTSTTTTSVSTTTKSSSSTTSPTTTTTSGQSVAADNKTNLWLIIGICVGVLAVILIIIIIIVWCKRRKTGEQKEPLSDSESQKSQPEDDRSEPSDTESQEEPETRPQMGIQVLPKQATMKSRDDGASNVNENMYDIAETVDAKDLDAGEYALAGQIR